jgi:pimeloyl-ACP methyl ester carboxylesterase
VTVRDWIRVAFPFALLLTACTTQPATSTVPSSASASAPELRDAPAPPDYRPPADAIDASSPGDLLSTIELTAPAGMRVWFIVYASTGIDGDPVAVSGLIAAPAAPPSEDGYPVVAWAHYTTGVADDCAPSLEGLIGIPHQVQSLVAQGYVVTATDYEGLGTDGIHPYIVGDSEGRSVLDSIRAVQSVPEAHAGDRAAVIGFSQGGHAALWAAELAAAYAPELDIVGSVAASPPSDLVAWERWLFDQGTAGDASATDPARLLFGVWSEVYDLPLDFLTDDGQQSAIAGRDACFPPFVSDNPYRSDPAEIPDWNQRLFENSPGATRTQVPLLVISPEQDESVVFSSQESGVGALCEIGDTVEIRTLFGTHADSFAQPASWNGAVAWVAARFVGREPENSCAA